MVRKKQHKVIFLHGNAPSHTARTEPICDTFETFSWKVLPRTTYSPDLAPSDYHLFATMTSRTCWAEPRFLRRCEKMTRWMVCSKRGRFLLARYSHVTREMGKCRTNEGAYFKLLFNVHIWKFTYHTCTPDITRKRWELQYPEIKCF